MREIKLTTIGHTTHEHRNGDENPLHRFQAAIRSGRAARLDFLEQTQRCIVQLRVVLQPLENRRGKHHFHRVVTDRGRMIVTAANRKVRHSVCGGFRFDRIYGHRTAATDDAEDVLFDVLDSADV